MPSSEALRADLRAVYDAALRAVEGERRVFEALSAGNPPESVTLIAMGKAAVSMTRGAMRALGDRIERALVITKHGYEAELKWPVLGAGHPLPDQQSLAAGARLVRFVADTPLEQVVLVLLSGGASSLVESLPLGVTLDQLRAMNQWLLASGFDIAAINRLRARVSLIKGGRLARLLAPRPVYCLAISDVPDDDPALIGSGPLTAVPSTTASADVPDFVRTMLDRAEPPPDVDDKCFGRVSYRIVANRTDALAAAVSAARDLGYDASAEAQVLRGDALKRGADLGFELKRLPPRCARIYGGETSVTLPAKPGRGGRNQSLALAAALAIEGVGRCALLAAGTDGSDGPGGDAGALVDGGTVVRGRAAGLDAASALREADAGTFLAASGDLFATGPTGTNVMDLCIGLRI